MFLGTIRIGNVVVLVIPSDQVLEYGTALPNLHLLSVLILVSQGRNTAIGVDLEEPGLLLLKTWEIDRFILCESQYLTGASGKLMRFLPRILSPAPPWQWWSSGRWACPLCRGRYPS